MSAPIPSPALPYAKPPSPPRLFLIPTHHGGGDESVDKDADAPQLLKQWRRVKGVSPLPIEPWLHTTFIEASLSVALACFSIVAATIALRHPARGPFLHRLYAWLKLPLACLFAVCIAWAMTFRLSRDPVAIAAAAALAFIASAAYPTFLLRTFRPSSDVLDGVR